MPAEVMTSESIKVEHIPGSERLVRILLPNALEDILLIHDLQIVIEDCLNNGIFNFILDFKNIQQPTSNLTALIIEKTSVARRQNGDIKLVNVNHTARNNLESFTPLGYLSLLKKESYAVEEFQKKSLRKSVFSADDIAEVPIVEKLQQKVKSGEQGRESYLRVQSVSSNLYKICDFITQHAEYAGMNVKDIGKTKIAVYEASLNIIEHAYHSDPDNWIDVWVESDPQRFIIYIKDYGTGFELNHHNEYDVKAAMEGRQTGGFGLYIIRRSMDEVDYEADAINGNRLKLVKYLNSETLG
ncbi:MAG: ATP-binding protein [bacterium]